ncbi:lysophospholipid acyltransferase family protein [Sphaerisporangium flaviroseum]|uniref:Lysophospholipid acyltransferase family protein n=1 Tax=Sphaerisporangium flaviroseum TaxID=509199 RepID=A0ABP7HEF4_9ACTN
MKQKDIPHDFGDEEPGTARVIPITSARRRSDGPKADAVEDRVVEFLAFLRRRLAGEYEVDEFGFDPELNDKVLLELIRPLYRHWFRVETMGLENVPDEAGALVVANHSGTVPVDALMLQVALHDEHPAHRPLRLLGADLVYQLPVLGHLSRKSGHTLACHEDADRLMRKGELVGVFPEGFKGVGKPFSERYKLQRFGRGGFVASAIRAQVPIIPCSIVGAEEIYPKIGNFRSLARLLGLPYIPITPLFPWLGPLGLLPLPSKWMIQFGEPVRTDQYDPEEADDPMLVFNLTDQVRELVQQQLNRLRLQRGHAFPPFF